MKLIFCIDCGDVRKLGMRMTKCRCGTVKGKYTDNLNAVWNGKGIMLGISNPSLASAITTHRTYGDREDRMGHRFEAFVIPDCAPTVTRDFNL